MIFITYGLWYDLVINLYKPFALKFLDRIGGTELHISLFNSLPGFAAALALLPGSFLLGRFQSKKNITSVFFALSRTFILMLALVPFFPKQYEPLIFVIMIAAINFADAIGQCSLQDFLGQAFDGFTRARTISLRNKFGNAGIPAITLITGLIISIIPKTDEQRILTYQIFFAFSFLCGIVEINIFRKLKQKPSENAVHEKPKLSDLILIVKDKKFVSFLGATLVFYFAWQAGWPLISILQIRTLGATEIWLAAISVSSGLASFLSAGFWAKSIAKRGNEKTLTIAAIGMAFNMFLYAITPNLIIMVIVSIYGGFVTIGTTISMFNGLLNTTPDKNRVLYLAVYNTFINISLTITPFFSLLLVNLLTIRPSIFIVGMLRLFAGLFLLLMYKRNKKKVLLD